MAIMWCTSGGNCPLRLSGAAMLSPSRIASRASSITRASSELWTMFFTMSSAVSSGTPELSSVASVLAKRASASMRISSPKMGSVSCLASHHSRPFWVLSHRRTPQAASGSPISSPYQDSRRPGERDVHVLEHLGDLRDHGHEKDADDDDAHQHHDGGVEHRADQLVAQHRLRLGEVREPGEHYVERAAGFT